MKIFFTGFLKAIKYVPTEPTLAIRIYDPNVEEGNCEKNQLQQSPLYKILEYTFEDLDIDRIVEHYPEWSVETMAYKTIPFDETIAQQIVSDFAQAKDDYSTLLVHCTLGASRSPAVAMALNDIFNLGNNSDKIKEQRPTYNRFVYRLLMENSPNNL